MPHKNLACKLQFSEELNASITTVIDVLRNNGINSPLNQHYIPGITLFTTTDETAILENLFKHIPQYQKFPISFSNVTSDPEDNNLVTLVPGANMRLKCFQSELYHGLTRGYPKRGLKLKEKFNPKLWTPHCPVAKFIAQNDSEMVADISQLISFPIVGLVDRLVLVELSVTKIYSVIPSCICS